MDKQFLPQYLDRSDITPIVDAALQMPLVIITAPMGYGKTTLIRKSMSSMKKHYEFWLVCGRNEIDEEWLWQRLCSVLEPSCPELAEILAQLKIPKTSSSISRLITIINPYIKIPTYIIVDDYQECDGDNLNRLFEALAYESVENLHLVIISRFFPNLPCHELWMKGLCELLEQDLFIMKKSDVNRLFELNGIRLPADDLNEIHAVTDGWIAAVYLALVNYRRYGIFRHTENIMLMLKGSIYDKLPENQQEQLMKLSVLDDFDADQASFVLEEELNLSDVISLSEKTGFIRYDPFSKTFQMHTLLKELGSLRLKMSGIDTARLLTLCGQWYERQKDYIHAAVYYIDAGCPQNVWDLMEKVGPESVFEKAPVIFQNFMDSFDLEEKMRHPKSYLLFIYFLMIKENRAEGKKLFREAVTYCESGKEKDQRLRHLRGELYIIESLSCFNDLTAMTACLGKAYELLDKSKSEIFDSSFLVTFGAPEMIALYLNKSGTLKRILELEKEYMTYFVYILNGAEHEWDELIEGEYWCLTGDLEKAEKFASIAYEKAKMQKRLCVMASCYYILLTCDLYFGRRIEFSRRILQMNQDLGVSSRLAVQIDFELVAGHIYGMLGQTGQIAPWIQYLDLADCNYFVRSVRSACIVHGVTLVRKKQWAALEGLASEMGRNFGSTSHIKAAIMSDLYHAIAALHLFGTEASLKYLREAVALSEPDHIIIPFLRCYGDIQPALDLLEQESEFVRSMLPSCRKFRDGVAAIAGSENRYYFTERERDIILLLQKGYKNTQISDALHIATVTVEKTLKNIYNKLSVTNRTEAVLKLQEISR